MTIKLSRRSAACVLLVIAPLLAVRAEDTRPNFIVVQPDDLHVSTAIKVKKRASQLSPT